MPPVLLMSLGSLTWCLLLRNSQPSWRSLFPGVEFCNCWYRGCMWDHTRRREEGKSPCFDDMPHERHCVCEQDVSVWPYALLPTARSQEIQHQKKQSTDSRSRPKNVKTSIRPEILWWLVGKALGKLLEAQTTGIASALAAIWKVLENRLISTKPQKIRAKTRHCIGQAFEHPQNVHPSFTHSTKQAKGDREH